jgi:hypothetical protein
MGLILRVGCAPPFHPAGYAHALKGVVGEVSKGLNTLKVSMLHQHK